MNVTQLYLDIGHPNRPGMTFTPMGVVVHRTGRDVGARWLHDYFNRDPQSVTDTGRYGSSQYGADDEGVIAFMPEHEVAWHCSADGQNFKRVGIETCQYFDEPPRIRPKTYANLVAWGADICKRYGWAPRELAEDGEPRFIRHQDADPVNRPSDPGDFLRWDEYLSDVEVAILGAPWTDRKEDQPMTDQQLAEIVGAIKGLASSVLVWLARFQRGIDVETGQPFDASRPPIDTRVRQ